jgi:hypothetical protein
MDDEERAKIARMCRRHAVFASTSEVHSALIEMAEYYERPSGSAVDPGEAEPGKLAD